MLLISTVIIKKAVGAETDSSILATRLNLSAEERNCDISIEISDGRPDSVLDLLGSVYIGTVHFSFGVYPSCDSWSHCRAAIVRQDKSTERL